MIRTPIHLPDEAWPVIGFAAITATALLAAPAIAAQLAHEWRLSPSGIGLYFSVEQGGICLAGLPAMIWLARLPWRRVAWIAGGAFILANLAATQAHTLNILLAARSLSALSGGTLMVLSMTLAGLSPERERLFGLWVLGQLVLGAALLWLLPRLFAGTGLWILYLILAGLMLAILPWACRYVPDRASTPQKNHQTHTPDWRLAVAGIGSVLIYYISYGGIWPFMARIAATGGMGAITSGTVLAIASLFGVAGASLATILARHKGRWILEAGYVLLASAIVLLFGAPGLVRFAVAAFLLKGVSTFTLPFILGRVASVDRDGRLMGATNMAVGGGLAIGPLLAGNIIQFGGGLAPMIAGGTVAMLVSAALLLPLRLSTRDAAPPLAIPAEV